MVDPRTMCRAHLMGEHVELHMFLGTIKKGISVAGYLRDNMLEPESLASRHAALVEEMTLRGYNHKSPLTEAMVDEAAPYFRAEGMTTAAWNTKVDEPAARAELHRRCPDCRARWATLYEGKLPE